MKLRTLIVFGTGVFVGLAIARKMHEDDPQVLHGPTAAMSPPSPARRVVSDQAQRLADRAGLASLSAIRRARVAIRERLGDDPYYDGATWS
jgi:hypothetical protein